MAPWAAGVSGNPSGRPPKGNAIADILNELLDDLKSPGVTRRRAILANVCNMAEAGDMRAVNFIAERTCGKVTENAQRFGIGPLEIDGVQFVAAHEPIRLFEFSPVGEKPREV
jgi:hypothetical protein